MKNVIKSKATKGAISKFVINRRNWGRGFKFADMSMLYNPENRKYCCLGQISIQCGVNRNDIKEKPAPNCIFEFSNDKNERIYNLFPKSFFTNKKDKSNSHFAYQAMSINDDKNINDAAREIKLIKLFKKYRIGLSFIN